MAALAEKRGVNCSQVLQDGLMKVFNDGYVESTFLRDPDNDDPIDLLYRPFRRI